MFRKILVPVDGSAFSESALPLAIAIARTSGADLRLAMVGEPADLSPGVWAEAFLANHAQYLDDTKESVQAEIGTAGVVSSILLEGPVSRSLCDEAESTRADLVIMSTHGHGGITRMWLGSVADAVLRHSPAPVLLVRPEDEDDGGASAPSSVTHVLVTLDGSPFAENAIAPGLEMARLFDARLTLLRTVTQPVMSSTYLPDTIEMTHKFLEGAEREARAYLADVILSRGLPADVGREVVVSVRPANGILDFAAESRADLVVMASHVRHGLSRAVIGSVADKVIRAGHKPVLIVHPTEAPRSATARAVG